jgi:hypothetical protein
MVKKSESPVVDKVRTLQEVSVEIPDRKEALANAASASCPKGVTNGPLELRAAAIVKAESRHLNIDARRRNLPRWTSVGSLDSKRPIGVMSSAGVSAFTCKIVNINNISTVLV